MIGNLVDLGIAFAVAANVGQAVLFVWIGPEVRSLAHIIVLVSARRRYGLIHNRKGSSGERFIGIALQLFPRWPDGLFTFIDRRARSDQTRCIEQKDSGNLIGATVIWLLALRHNRGGAETSQRARRGPGLHSKKSRIHFMDEGKFLAEPLLNVVK